ncbi:glycosyltransferase family 92 protein [Holotrichia oblita]|uniref:Glycosyltransferase family 92 protein n=1 Tax=Holotrichia oblita TaxID=644536 RepID=A0ACB9T6M2_HOLOL|nr:glycosyltransferase family 92 protein [Holotrichia oblita]
MTRTFLQWILLAYLSGLVVNESQTRQLRVVHKLVGGHISLSKNDDAELLTSSAGDGKDPKKKTSESKETKTLAQQVADGKYALIQTELFSRPIKKPGLLSYRENSEVPRDTITNLGGLNKSDIWLSENHLLVIKGGSFPQHSAQNLETEVWPSLDDYHAPNRQVKIPSHPKVPPPFPVQLTDGGPLLLLGTNATKTLNGTFPPPIYPVFPEENFVPNGEPPPGNKFILICYPDRYPPNVTSGQAPFPIPPFPGPGLDYYDPAKERPLNGSPPYFPFIGPADISGLDNVTYDEDDPSIYYPPPYSFYYNNEDNSTQVPPGPLVPGIVLPPPPNFFAPLEENKTEAPTTTYTPPIQTTTTTTESPTIKAILTHNFTIPTLRPVYRKPTPTIANIAKKYPTITILKAITPSIGSGRESKQNGRGRTKTVVTTTRVPLKSYYTSKPKQFLEEVVVNIPKVTTSRPQTQFYFYDENIINTTPKLRQPPPQKYIPGDYYLPAKELDFIIKEPPREKQNLRYYYVDDNTRSQYPERTDSFSVHIARLKNQINSFQSALINNNDNNYYRRPQYNNPVYQYSFQSVNYPNRNQYLPPEYSIGKNTNQDYDVEIQEAIEVTPPPAIYETTQEDTFYYPESATENPRKYKGQIRNNRPKTISQYSYEGNTESNLPTILH